MRSSRICSLAKLAAGRLVWCICALAILMVSQQTLGQSSYSQAWIRQFGTTGYEFTYSVGVDSTGRIVIVGETAGDLGGPPIGSDDVFMIKLDPGGAPLWQAKLGSRTQDYCGGVAVDSSNNVLVGGVSYPLYPANYSDYTFLAKYNAAGDIQWSDAFRTSHPNKEGVTVCFDAAGAAYVSGWADNELPGTGATGGGRFIAKYDADGGRVWTSVSLLERGGIMFVKLVEGVGSMRHEV